MSTLKTWMAQATTAQQLELARRIDSSRGHLYHLSNGHRTASADFGGAVERETRAMADQGLPIVTRGELVPACAACSYYKTCKVGK